MHQDSGSVRSDGDVSPDREDRIKDFLARHGGEGSAARREEKTASGDGGWYEVYAADGHTLHCEWSRVGSREEIKFSELAPRTHAGGTS